MGNQKFHDKKISKFKKIIDVSDLFDGINLSKNTKMYQNHVTNTHKKLVNLGLFKV